MCGTTTEHKSYSSRCASRLPNSHLAGTDCIPRLAFVSSQRGIHGQRLFQRNSQLLNRLLEFLRRHRGVNVKDGHRNTVGAERPGKTCAFLSLIHI